MNLLRHQTRRDFGNGALVAMDVPYEEIVVWEGKDAFSYEKTYQLYEDAVADGFVHFQYMLTDYADDWMPIAFASHHWNWCRILRYIATELCETAIVLLDDIYFSKRFEVMIDIRDYAEQMAAHDETPLKIVGLNYNDRAKPEFRVPNAKLIPPDNRLFRGIPSNAFDTASIITPLGAEWLLEEWVRLGTEYHIYSPILEHTYTVEFRRFGVDIFSGIYCVGRPEFICYMNKSVAPSTMHVETDTGTDFSRYIRPAKETQRVHT